MDFRVVMVAILSNGTFCTQSGSRVENVGERSDCCMQLLVIKLTLVSLIIL